MGLVSATLTIASTGAGQGAIATVPAPPAGQRIRINYIEIAAYTTVARVGGATPITVSTTNLGGLFWYFATAGLIGAADRVVFQPKDPIDAVTQGQSVVINCPATASVRWIINICYHYEEI